ncbi:MAG TPA: DNA polymerase III subunit gamma/tau [Candidatus Limnocylindrales bacterium]|nr:DNA polymerase III subunit gamma/tau [Candidatus Limnocylindrales bacterium]
MSSTAPHQALYRRWRAQRFSEIVGQTAVVETLRNAVRADRVSHAILFVGPRGTGKTSLARILAKALNCTNLQDGDPCDACEACVAIREGRAIDLVEIDAASNRGIESIRDLRDRINYAPSDLRRKVYILDEAHQITKDAWNALLKSLEEPPDFVAFMFASTHPQDFPPAILSRLQRYDVRRLSIEEIESKLERILAAESVTAEPGAVRLIARLAAGGMRDAESMLDQILASGGGRIDEAAVRELLGLADTEVVARLIGAFLAGDAPTGMAVFAELDDRGRDAGVVLEQMVEVIRADLAATLAPDGDRARGSALAGLARRLAAIDPERRGVGGTRFQLELALLEAATRLGTAAASVRSTPAAAPVADSAAARPTASPPVRAEPDEQKAKGRAAPVEPATPRPPEPAAAEPAAVAPEPDATTPEPDATTPELEPVMATQPTTPKARTLKAPAATDAATPTESPPTGAAAKAPGGVEELRAHWPEVVAFLSRNPPVKPLIEACRPVSVDGHLVTLGFPEDMGFLKNALERRASILEEGIGRVLGRSVNVRCVATNLEHVPAVAIEAENADLISEARRIFAEDLVDVGEVS